MRGVVQVSTSILGVIIGVGNDVGTGSAAGTGCDIGVGK